MLVSLSTVKGKRTINITSVHWLLYMFYEAVGKLTPSANIYLRQAEAGSFRGAVRAGAALGLFEAFSKGFWEYVQCSFSSKKVSHFFLPLKKLHMYCACCEDLMSWVDAALGSLGCVQPVQGFKLPPKNCGKSMRYFSGRVPQTQSCSFVSCDAKYKSGEVRFSSLC